MNLADANLDELVDVVRAEAEGVGRRVDLTGAELRSGWESVVLATADWIYRFPRPHVNFRREVTVLRRLRDRLPVPIPTPEWFGARTPFMAYRRLTGAAFDPVAYERASPTVRNRLARSLARFLASMHAAMSAGEVLELGIPGSSSNSAEKVRADQGDLERIETAIRDAGGGAGVVREYVPTLLDEVRRQRARTRETERVLLHDDFNASNFALSGPVGELVAVWDFSCVRVGDPATDLRYLLEDSADLFDRVVAAYQDITGRALDRSTAVLASRLEEVSDAIELDDLDGLARRIRRWRAEDGG